MTTCSSNLDFGKIRRRKAKSRSSIIHLKQDTKSLDIDTDSCDEAIDVTNYDEPVSPPEVCLSIFDLLNLHSEFTSKENAESLPYDTDPGYGSASSVSTYETSHSSFRVTNARPPPPVDPSRFRTSPVAKPESPIKNSHFVKTSVPKRIDDLLELDHIFKKSLVISCEKLDLDNFCRKNRFVRSSSDSVLMVPQTIPVSEKEKIVSDELDISHNSQLRQGNSTSALNIISDFNSSCDVPFSKANKTAKPKSKINVLKPAIRFSSGSSILGSSNKLVVTNSNSDSNVMNIPHKVILSRSPSIITTSSSLFHHSTKAIRTISKTNETLLLSSNAPKIGKLLNYVDLEGKPNISTILQNTQFDNNTNAVLAAATEKCDISKKVANLDVETCPVDAFNLYNQVEIIPKFEEAKQEVFYPIDTSFVSKDENLTSDNGCAYVSSENESESDSKVTFDIIKEMEHVMLSAKAKKPSPNLIKPKAIGLRNANNIVADHKNHIKRPVSNDFGCSRYNAELDDLLFGSSFGSYNLFDEIEIENPEILDIDIQKNEDLKEDLVDFKLEPKIEKEIVAVSPKPKSKKKSGHKDLKPLNIQPCTKSSDSCKSVLPSEVTLPKEEDSSNVYKKLTLKIGRKVEENCTSFSILGSNSNFEVKEALDSESDTKSLSLKTGDVFKQPKNKRRANKLKMKTVTSLSSKSRRKCKSELNVDPNIDNALKSAFDSRSNLTEPAADVEKKCESSSKFKTERRKGRGSNKQVGQKSSRPKPIIRISFLKKWSQERRKKKNPFSNWQSKKKAKYKKKTVLVIPKMASNDVSKSKSKSQTSSRKSVKDSNDSIRKDNSSVKAKISDHGNTKTVNSNGISGGRKLNSTDSTHMSSSDEKSTSSSAGKGTATIEPMECAQDKSDIVIAGERSKKATDAMENSNAVAGEKNCDKTRVHQEDETAKSSNQPNKPSNTDSAQLDKPSSLTTITNKETKSGPRSDLKKTVTSTFGLQTKVKNRSSFEDSLKSADKITHKKVLSLSATKETQKRRQHRRIESQDETAKKMKKVVVNIEKLDTELINASLTKKVQHLENKTQEDTMQEERTCKMPDDKTQEDKMKDNVKQQNKTQKDRMPEDKTQQDRMQEDETQQDKTRKDKAQKIKSQEDKDQEDKLQKVKEQGDKSQKVKEQEDESQKVKEQEDKTQKVKEQEDKSQKVKEQDDGSTNDADVSIESVKLKRTSRTKVPKKVYSPDEPLSTKSVESKRENKPIKNSDSKPSVTTTPKQKLKYNPEDVKIPFKYGWMREVVHRAVTGKATKAIDIYYFTPEGSKLRSMPDIAKYLSDHKEVPLTINNFTFCKELIHREPFEKERGARVRLADGTETTAAVTPVSKATPKSVNRNKLAKLPKTQSPSGDLSLLVLEKSEDTSKSLQKTARKSMKPVPSATYSKKSDREVVNSQTKTSADSSLLSSGEDIEQDVQQLRDSSSTTDKRIRRTTKRLYEETDSVPAKKPKKLAQGLPSPCTSRCSVALYQIPTLQCRLCLCMFHHQCVDGEKDSVFHCKACQIKMKSSAPTTEKPNNALTDSDPPPLIVPEVSLQLSKGNGSKTSIDTPTLPPPPPLQRAPDLSVPVPSNATAFRVTLTPLRPRHGAAPRNIAFQSPRMPNAVNSMRMPSPFVNMTPFTQTVMPTPASMATTSSPLPMYSTASFNNNLSSAAPPSRFVLLQQPSYRSSSISIIPSRPIPPFNLAVPRYAGSPPTTGGIGNLTVRLVLPSSISASDIMKSPPILTCTQAPVSPNKSKLHSALTKEVPLLPNTSSESVQLNKAINQAAATSSVQSGNSKNISSKTTAASATSTTTVTSSAGATIAISSVKSIAVTKSNSDEESSSSASSISTAESECVQKPVKSKKVKSKPNESKESSEKAIPKDSFVTSSVDDEDSGKDLRIDSSKRRKSKRHKHSRSSKKNVSRKQKSRYSSSESSDDSSQAISRKSKSLSSKAVSCNIVDSKSSSAHANSVDLNSFTAGYNCLNMIFKGLQVNDLLKVSQVNRSWLQLASQTFLWKNISFHGLYIKDWIKCSAALKKHGTKHLNLRGMRLEDLTKDWKDFSSGLNNLSNIEFITFGQVPPSVVEAVADKLPLLQHLECYCITKTNLRPELWTTPCSLKFFNFRFLRKLKKLKIRSSGGLEVEQEPNEIRYLSDLQHLSLTSLKKFPGSYFNFISHLPNLVSLELGDCCLWTKDNYQALGKLTKLQQLHLEIGGGFDVGMADALKNLINLKELELMKFIIPDDLGSALEGLTHLSTVGLWPDNSKEALTAKINLNTLRSAEKMKQISYFCWGIISPDDCIPLLPLLKDLNEMDGASTENMHYEDLFQHLCSSLPDAKVEMKCISEDFFNEYCCIQRSK